MQDSKYLEQLRQELVELSPDFAHDEHKIKKLITYMLTHKIKVEQDNHFKDQLADRLSRHIAWSQESHEIDPKVQAKTSRLGRFIAYGLPGFIITIVIIITFPEISIKHLYDDAPFLQSTIKSIDVDDISSSQNQSLVDENKPITQSQDEESVSQLIPAIKETVDSESVMATDQTVIPSLQKLSVSESSAILSDELSTLSWVKWSWDIWTYSSHTISERKSYAKSLQESLWQVIIQEGTIVTCDKLRDAMYCTVLYNWPLTSDNRELLKKEIMYASDSSYKNQ